MNGMQLIGQHPTAIEGVSYVASVWYWQPMWDFCLRLTSDWTDAEEYRLVVDGGELDETCCLALAQAIEEAQLSGKVDDAEMDDARLRDALPAIVCGPCRGTGNLVTGTDHGPEDRPCSWCKGVGSRPSTLVYYQLRGDDLEALRLFLLHCGGAAFRPFAWTHLD